MTVILEFFYCCQDKSNKCKNYFVAPKMYNVENGFLTLSLEFISICVYLHLVGFISQGGVMLGLALY